MDVLIEGLLDQVLWLEASEGGHPLVEEDQLQIQRCSGGQFFLRTSSRQNRQNHHIDEKFKTNLNIKTLLCILISVMEEGGNEWATATKPTLGSDVLQFGQNVNIDRFIFFVNRLFIKFWVKPCLFVWELEVVGSWVFHFEVAGTVDHLVSIFVFLQFLDFLRWTEQWITLSAYLYFCIFGIFLGGQNSRSHFRHICRKKNFNYVIKDTGGAVAHLISSICESRVSFCQNTFHSKNKEALEFNIWTVCTRSNDGHLRRLFGHGILTKKVVWK